IPGAQIRAQATGKPPAVLIYAGGSVFGRLLAADLLERTDARLLLVGRDGGPEEAAARDLDPGGRRIRAGRADLKDGPGLRRLLAGMTVAVCCVRGFRGVPASLVDACIAQGVAYFDIADSRGFVRRVLDRRPAIEAAQI